MASSIPPQPSRPFDDPFLRAIFVHPLVSVAVAAAYAVMASDSDANPVPPAWRGLVLVLCAVSGWALTLRMIDQRPDMPTGQKLVVIGSGAVATVCALAFAFGAYVVIALSSG